MKHLRGPDAPGVEGIPLEFCFSDGVRLDFTDRESGYRITVADIDEALAWAKKGAIACDVAGEVRELLFFPTPEEATE